MPADWKSELALLIRSLRKLVDTTTEQIKEKQRAENHETTDPRKEKVSKHR